MVPEETSKAEARSPGQLLRSGREAAGLTIQQVAEKLHLLQSVVSSLEKDSYERIRGDTFVRGYMRNYAKLVGLDGDEVVGCYNAARAGSGRQESRFNRRREPSGGAGRVGMVAALLGLSSLFLLGNREPVAQTADISPGSITVETPRGEQRLDLDAGSRFPGASQE
jgi:cytoskeleton protein RodZ